jgi:hypothetical protein
MMPGASRFLSVLIPIDMPGGIAAEPFFSSQHPKFFAG